MEEKPKSTNVPGCVAKGCICSVVAFVALVATCTASMDRKPSTYERTQARLEASTLQGGVTKPELAKAEPAKAKPAEKAPRPTEDERDLPWANYTPPGPVGAVVAVKDTAVLTTPGGTSLGTLRKGDAVKLEGQKGGYYEIVLFSGEYRYVKASDCRGESASPKPPADEQRARVIFKAICDAEARAGDESEQAVSSDIKTGVKVQRELEDRYKLEAAQVSGVSPLVADQVSLLGVLEKWPPLY